MLIRKASWDISKEIYEKLGFKPIAAHTTASGYRAYCNIGNKQVIRIDICPDAKREVEALLKGGPYYKCNTVQKEVQQ